MREAVISLAQTHLFFTHHGQAERSATGLRKIQESVVGGRGFAMAGTLQPLCRDSQQVSCAPLSRPPPTDVVSDGEMYGLLLIHFRQGRSQLLCTGAFGHADSCPDPTALIDKMYSFFRDAIASHYTNRLLTNARYASIIKAIASLKDLTSLRDSMSVSPSAMTGGAQCAQCYQNMLSVIRNVTYANSLG